MKKRKKRLYVKERLSPGDIDVQFNINDDTYRACALYDAFHMAMCSARLDSPRVLKRVAKRFEFQVESDAWKGSTTIEERNLFRRLAKYLRSHADRKSRGEV